MSQISTVNVTSSYARLGANHGYVIDGDVAQLHADVERLSRTPLAGNWALQLWACESPHITGPLRGVKVAEAEFTGFLSSDHTRRFETAAQARVPGGRRDYAMVLVLASGDDDRYTQIHDFANYPSRQRFATPHFDGSAGYEIDRDQVVLRADRIYSPRDVDNISGSLSLELWALSEPYSGGTFEGHVLARADLGRLQGQSAIHSVAMHVPFSPPPDGNWSIVVMLREWAGSAGYVTRDYVGFDVRYVVAQSIKSIASVVPPNAEEQVVEAQVGAADHRVSINSGTVA